MPTRRTMELVIITVVLLAPVLSMVNLWARKHIIVTGSGPAAEAAAVVEQIV